MELALYSRIQTRNVPVAAAQVSQPDCVKCGKTLRGDLSPHLCEACGWPQPLPTVDSVACQDFFAVLGVTPKFHLEKSALERRFYQLSRVLHPDRFSSLGSEAKQISMERMSLLNRALTTLKNSDDLRSYLLKLKGIDPTAKSKPPIEWAEIWFEIQDLLFEDPEQGRAKLLAFEEDLKNRMIAEEKALFERERKFDEDQSGETLMEIANSIQLKNYLQSMERDIARVKERTMYR